MRNVSVGLRIGLAAIALGLVSLGAAQTWIQGFDAAHTGVSPYEFTPPLALVWKFSSDEAIEEARRGPSWLRGAGPGEVGPEMMGPAMGGEMGMAPGAPGEMMGGMPGPGGPAGLPGPGMMGAPGAGGVPGFRATSLPKPLAAPAVAPDRILFAVGQNVYCVDRVTGAKLWNRNIGSTVYGSPAFCEGYFYVADDAGRIHALKAENGSEDWVFRLDKGVRSGITIHENVLYVGCDD
ncbi:MAG: PQQ-binding-like beta-propeller repeat protein, partial [Armatimonadetes bacterium]|nr:PQQ-binding-like beta-propeller repeat protein [Armatimonadota bacterium]